MAYYNPYYDFTTNLYNKNVDPRTIQYGEVSKLPNKVGGKLNIPNPQQSQNAVEPATGGNATGIVSSALGGLSNALSEQNSDPNDFSIDPYAGIKGSGQGLAQGGWVGAIIGGITSQVGTFNKVHSNLRNLDKSVAAGVTDPQGRVAYSSQAVNEAQAKADALKKGNEAIKKSIDPATHLISGIFGTRKKLRRARRKLIGNTRSAQQRLNSDLEAQNNQDLAMEQYNQLLNNKTRLNNLYSIGTNLY